MRTARSVSTIPVLRKVFELPSVSGKHSKHCFRANHYDQGNFRGDYRDVYDFQDAAEACKVGLYSPPKELIDLYQVMEMCGAISQDVLGEVGWSWEHFSHKPWRRRFDFLDIILEQGHWITLAQVEQIIDMLVSGKDVGFTVDELCECLFLTPTGVSGKISLGSFKRFDGKFYVSIWAVGSEANLGGWFSGNQFLIVRDPRSL